MRWVRHFILSQSCNIIYKFETELLSTFWKDYHILVWNLNKKFNAFTGEEVKAFIRNLHLVIGFLEDTFEITEDLGIVCKSLDLRKMSYVHYCT